MEEDPDYLSRQLITYIGNKRALLDFIGQGLETVLRRLGRPRLTAFDVFSGSGVVSRYLKRYAQTLHVCDLESYSEIINRCYLANSEDLDILQLKEMHHELLQGIDENTLLNQGLFQQHYAPRNDQKILPGERVFYTSRNARFLDTLRSRIARLPAEWQPFFLAPLLSEASIHANTAGVFKGFYKNSETGIGQFGGRKSDALQRILGPIELPFPVFSRFSSQVHVYRGDAAQVVKSVGEVDLAYLDPPYNQHPYGSNYFMLNLLVDYRLPQEISPVSGIPKDWNRSSFNKKQLAFETLESLIQSLQARFIMVSFNSEGFIPQGQMEAMLSHYGRLETLQVRYNTFRGSRNLHQREIHVHEYLYLLEKHG